MGYTLLKKFRDMLVTLWLIVTLVFLMFTVIPGNSAEILAGLDATPERVAALEKTYGLDQPIPIQYVRYLGRLLTGDLGDSIRFGQPVGRLMGQAALTTLSLAGYAFLLILIFGLILGILAAIRPRGLVDLTISTLTEATLAVPPFFMAILLMLVFRFAHTGGIQQPHLGFGGWLAQYTLPALAIALSRLAMVVSFLRDAIAQQWSMDYVRTARSKGASLGRILRHHVLRNSMVPTITALGLILTEVISGSVIIEQVFLLPGLGRLLVTAVEARDFPLSQGIILWIAFFVVVVNFFVDILNQYADPRLRITARPFGKWKGHRS